MQKGEMQSVEKEEKKKGALWQPSQDGTNRTVGTRTGISEKT